MEIEKFETGAVRSSDTVGARWDLIHWPTYFSLFKISKEADLDLEFRVSRNLLFAITEIYDNNSCSSLKEQFLITIDVLGMQGIAEAYWEGAQKYKPGNYKKGFPAEVLLNHAARHLYKASVGDSSEPHIGHAMWNIFVYFEQKVSFPEFDVIKKESENEKSV